MKPTGSSSDSGPLNALREVAPTWSKLCLRAMELLPQTLDFWYGERALVGLLAAAFWKHGMPAVAETRVSRSRAQRVGHADLLVSVKGERLVAEAKVCWLSDPGDSGRPRTALTRACRDARSLPRRVLGHRFGVAFLVIWPFVGGASRGELRDVVEAQVEMIKPHLVARAYNDQRDYPGIFLIARSVEKTVV